MRICHTLATHLHSGPAEPVINLCRALAARGHEVSFLHDSKRKGGIAEYAAGLGEPALRCALSTKSGPVEIFRDLAALRRFLRAPGLDVLHANFSHDHALAVLARTKDARGPLIVRAVHSERSLSRRPMQAWLFRRTDGVVTVCEGHARRMREAFDYPAEKLSVVRGAVDGSRFRPGLDGTAIRRASGIPPDAKVMGTVARFQKGRGHERLIRLVPEILKAEPRVVLSLCGRGELEMELKALAAKLDLEKRVFFIGYHTDDLPQVYASFDVFVILREGNDASCRALLQAMACGRPAVGTARPPILEAIMDGETGLVVEEDDDEALCRAVLEILAGGGRVEGFGAAGRKRIEADFSPERQAAEVEAFYKRVIAMGRLA